MRYFSELLSLVNVACKNSSVRLHNNPLEGKNVEKVICMRTREQDFVLWQKDSKTKKCLIFARICQTELIEWNVCHSSLYESAGSGAINRPLIRKEGFRIRRRNLACWRDDHHRWFCCHYLHNSTTTQANRLSLKNLWTANKD